MDDTEILDNLEGALEQAQGKSMAVVNTEHLARVLELVQTLGTEPPPPTPEPVHHHYHLTEAHEVLAVDAMVKITTKDADLFRLGKTQVGKKCVHNWVSEEGDKDLGACSKCGILWKHRDDPCEHEWVNATRCKHCGVFPKDHGQDLVLCDHVFGDISMVCIKCGEPNRSG